MDFSVIYYIKSSVVALFSVKPMYSVNPMSVKVMHHCISLRYRIPKTMAIKNKDFSELCRFEVSDLNERER